MVSRWQWNFRKLWRRIWFQIAVFGVLGVLTAIGAVMLGPLVPPSLPAILGSESVSVILNIMASSMLAVTTFSVSIMLSAFNAASSAATPRATVLLRDDHVTQRVLATFMGGFVFSLTGIIGLQTGLYTEAGRFVLFIVTLSVLIAIIWQLVRWINHLSDYGRMTDTIARVESAAESSLSRLIEQPFLRARPLLTPFSTRTDKGTALYPDRIGYVQMIDVAALQETAAAAGVQVAVAARPGAFVHRSSALLHILAVTPATAVPTDGLSADLRAAFAIEPTRTFEQDPRFGLIALAEIASRALSPAVNDPGTAIDILGRMVRLLSRLSPIRNDKVDYDNVYVPCLQVDDLLADAFAPIARDGAGMVEVQMRVQKSLIALAQLDPALFGPSAMHQSHRSLAFAQTGLVLGDDREIIRDLHRAVVNSSRAPSELI